MIERARAVSSPLLDERADDALITGLGVPDDATMADVANSDIVGRYAAPIISKTKTHQLKKSLIITEHQHSYYNSLMQN